MLNPVGRADASTVDVAALREDEAGAAVLTVMGPAGARSIPLPEAGRLTVGRHANSDVCLKDDPAVSRHHAVLHLSPALEVEDLGAANGTFVGGRRVPGGGRRIVRGLALAGHCDRRTTQPGAARASERYRNV